GWDRAGRRAPAGGGGSGPEAIGPGPQRDVRAGRPRDLRQARVPGRDVHRIPVEPWLAGPRPRTAEHRVPPAAARVAARDARTRLGARHHRAVRRLRTDVDPALRAEGLRQALARADRGVAEVL